MMMEQNFFGRCVMNTNRCLHTVFGLALCLGAGIAGANPAADTAVSPQAEAAYQVEDMHPELDWRLDPTVFTEISPVSVPEVAIKLPEDQEDDG
jgi:hypothetical protein